jgi:hypothetical protein
MNKFVVGGTARGTLPAIVDPDDGITPVTPSALTCLVIKNGTDTGDSVTIIAVGGGRTGVYKWSYDPAGEAEFDEFSLVFTITIDGDPYYHTVDLIAAVAERGTDGANTTTPPTVAAIADEVQTRTIARVTLVDTCTVNSDMRGTDNAALAVTALSTATWTGTLATNIGTTNSTVASNLDATVSSRLASASYASPPSAATNATAVRSELTLELGRIDADISSRLASASYTAPDNAGVAAIKAVTDKIDTGLVLDGSVYQFTANMLELGPSGGASLTAQQVWEYATRSLTEAVELDSATLVRFVTEDTGETAAAAGSVAKLAQGSGSGGSTTVTVLPATGIVANRSAGVTLTPVVGETISQAITVYQSDGTTAVDLSGKTLKIIFETMSGADVAVVLAADITIGGTDGNVVTFAYPSAVTASERTLRFAIRDAAAPLTMYLQGVCSVVAAPKVDA